MRLEFNRTPLEGKVKEPPNMKLLPTTGSSPDVYTAFKCLITRKCLLFVVVLIDLIVSAIVYNCFLALWETRDAKTGHGVPWWIVIATIISFMQVKTLEYMLFVLMEQQSAVRMARMVCLSLIAIAISVTIGSVVQSKNLPERIVHFHGTSIPLEAFLFSQLWYKLHVMRDQSEKMRLKEHFPTLM